MTDTELAWLSGLFEGEGCMSDTGRNSVQIHISSTDHDVLERVLKITGVGSIKADLYQLRARPQTKPIYKWRACSKKDVTCLIEAMLPWFGTRRRIRALDALERLSACKG